jgi:hypothetical protein
MKKNKDCWSNAKKMLFDRHYFQKVMILEIFIKQMAGTPEKTKRAFGHRFIF